MDRYENEDGDGGHIQIVELYGEINGNNNNNDEIDCGKSEKPSNFHVDRGRKKQRKK